MTSCHKAQILELDFKNLHIESESFKRWSDSDIFFYISDENLLLTQYIALS